MRPRLSQIATHATCCVGLLLVSAVQQKLCALPPAHHAAGVPRAQRSGEHPQHHQKTRPRLTLTALVPDVAPPRWPGHLRLAATQRGKPLPPATWCRGDGSAERFGPCVPAAADAFVLRRAAFRPAVATITGGSTLHSIQRSAGLFRSTVLRTGPPAV